MNDDFRFIVGDEYKITTDKGPLSIACDDIEVMRFHDGSLVFINAEHVDMSREWILNEQFKRVGVNLIFRIRRNFEEDGQQAGNARPLTSD